MRLRHIEVLSAIMQTGSTTAAARLLHVSQPAVSKMLQHAEQTLGFPLFLRSGAKLVPTPEAMRLQQLQPVAEQLLRIRRIVFGLATAAEAPLRIGATRTTWRPGRWPRGAARIPHRPAPWPLRTRASRALPCCSTKRTFA